MKTITIPEHVDDEGSLQSLSDALGHTLRLLDAVEQQERNLHHRSEVQALLAERRITFAIHQVIKGILRNNDRIFSGGFQTLASHYLHLRRRLEGAGYTCAVTADIRQGHEPTTRSLEDPWE